MTKTSITFLRPNTVLGEALHMSQILSALFSLPGIASTAAQSHDYTHLFPGITTLFALPKIQLAALPARTSATIISLFLSIVARSITLYRVSYISQRERCAARRGRPEARVHHIQSRICHRVVVAILSSVFKLVCARQLTLDGKWLSRRQIVPMSE